MRSPLLRSASFLVAYFLILVAAAIPKGLVPRRFADVTWGTVASLTIYALTRWLVARERRDVQDAGLALHAGSVGRLVLGVGVGFVVYAATVAVTSLSVGPVHFAMNDAPSAVTWTLTVVGFLALSCMEELGFRAYPLQTLTPALGHWPAQFVVAAVFAVFHGLAGWPWDTVLLGVLPSGLLFGIVATRSRGLAMPIGLHAALNIAYWMVGAKETPGVWTLRVDPAASARVATFAPFIGLVVMLVACAVVVWWPSRSRESPDPFNGSESLNAGSTGQSR